MAEDKLYDRLYDLSLIIVCNLNEINDIEYVKEVLDIIKGTRVNIFREIFIDAVKYYNMHKSLPDYKYVSMHFPALIEELDGDEPDYHYSFQNEYIKLLRRDAVLQKVNEAVSQDDIKLIEQIVESDPLFNTDVKKLKTLDDLMSEYDKLKNLKDPLTWGIADLDKLYKGLCPGTLNILSAPPGKFKTTTSNSIAYCNFTKGKKVLYITLEDSWDVVYFNFMAREAYEHDRHLDAGLAKIGRLDDYDESTLREMIEKYACKYRDNIRVVCPATWDDFSPHGIMRLLRQVFNDMGGLDLVVVDHASLFKFYPIKGINDPKEVVNFYIRFLTNLSLSFEDKFALLVLSQTNREGIKNLEAGKSGSLTNLAEANEQERSASTVTLIYSGPNSIESNMINFFPKKNRRGALNQKPVVTFIEPGAYFVGERVVTEDLSFSDIIASSPNIKKRVKSLNKTNRVKSISVKSEDEDVEKIKPEIDIDTDDEEQESINKAKLLKKIRKKIKFNGTSGVSRDDLDSVSESTKIRKKKKLNV